MPLSSRASRSATSSPVVSPGSPWPPGCSQRSSLRWWRSRTREPSAETVIALPVRWPSAIARSKGRSWRRTKARIRSRSLRFFLVGRGVAAQRLGQGRPGIAVGRGHGSAYRKLRMRTTSRLSLPAETTIRRLSGIQRTAKTSVDVS